MHLYCVQAPPEDEESEEPSAALEALAASQQHDRLALARELLDHQHLLVSELFMPTHVLHG